MISPTFGGRDSRRREGRRARVKRRWIGMRSFALINPTERNTAPRHLTSPLFAATFHGLPATVCLRPITAGRYLAASRPRSSILLRFCPRQSAADFHSFRPDPRPICGYERTAQLSYHSPQRFPQLPFIQLHRHLTTLVFLLESGGEFRLSTVKLHGCSVSVGRCRGKTRGRPYISAFPSPSPPGANGGSLSPFSPFVPSQSSFGLRIFLCLRFLTPTDALRPYISFRPQFEPRC